MRKFILFVSAIFICSVCFAHTVNWYIDDEIYQTTTCSNGDNITTPTAPTKPGYTFMGWYPYVPIEYLESTGTQYIDTGFIANQDTRVITKVHVRGMGWLFGARQGVLNSSFCIANNSNKSIRTDYGSKELTLNCDVNDCLTKQVLIIDKNKNITTVYKENNAVFLYGESPYANFNSVYNFYLFAFNNAGNAATISEKVYYFKIYDNDVLVRDFIPVLDVNGTPCMYDKLEEKFYYNAGTGNFIAGPIIHE